MLISDVYTSGYLKAEELGANRPTVTISQCNAEVFEKTDGPNAGEKETKPVLSFEGKSAVLVLNKTNANSIVELYGNNTDDWIGKGITLFSAKVQFGAKMVDAIRITAPEGAAPQPQPQATPLAQPAGIAEDDDVPF